MDLEGILGFIFCSIMLSFLVGLGYVLVVMLPKHVDEQQLAKANFMTECLHDHKQYECTALYRQTDCRDTSSPTFIPMYVPMYR